MRRGQTLHLAQRVLWGRLGCKTGQIWFFKKKKKKKIPPHLAGEPAISSQFDVCGLITSYENTSFLYLLLQVIFFHCFLVFVLQLIVSMFAGNKVDAMFITIKFSLY